MELCASVQALLAKDSCQIVEGFVVFIKINCGSNLQVFQKNIALFPQISNNKAYYP